MFCAALRKTVGQSYRLLARRLWRVVLCILILSFPAAPALSDSATDSDVTAHLLIGMKPNQGFEVTCEDSVIFQSPVVADELGILEFDVEGRFGPPPTTVYIRVPGPPQIAGQHMSSVADTTAVASWLTDRPATSLVEYGTTQSYGKSTPEHQALLVTHNVVLEDLSPETIYHCRVISRDAFGNVTTGSDQSFLTTALAPAMSHVSVLDVTETSFAVEWTTNRPCNSSVEYGTTDGYGQATTPTSVLTTEHQVIVPGLDPGSEYHARAISTDEFGRTVLSVDRVVTTAGGQLSLYDLAVSDTASARATVTWMTTSPASSWVIYGSGSLCDEQCGCDEFVTGHSVTLAGLDSNTLYKFFVLSRDASGTTVHSEEYFFSTGCMPLEIAGPHVAGTTQTTVTVSWTTSRPSDGLVEYGEDESYGQTVSGDTTMSIGHQVMLEDLDPGVEYHLRAVSTDEFGCTAVSEDLAVQTDPPGLSIFAVTVPETTAISATLGWQTTNASFSHVEYGPTESYGFATDESPFALTEHAVVLGDLLPRTQYHFRVHATDIFGQEAISGDSTLTTPSQDGPCGLLVYGVVASQIGPTFASVCWQTNAIATSAVHYGVTLACGLSVSDAELTKTHCLVLAGLAPGTRYYYHVASSDGGSLEAESQIYSFRTPASDVVPPGSPSGLAASSCQGGVRLLWSASQEYDLEGYRLYRRSEGDRGFDMVAELPSGQTSYVDLHLLDRWTYEYAMTAFDESGNESNLSLAVAATAGIGDYAQVWVYPNPATQKITTVSFTSSAGGPYTISIYDARGRLVRTLNRGNASGRVSSEQWDTRDNTGFPVPSGTYFCVVSLPGETIRSKIMVIR